MTGVQKDHLKFKCEQRPASSGAVTPEGYSSSWGLIVHVHDTGGGGASEAEYDLQLLLSPSAPIGRYQFRLKASAPTEGGGSAHTMPISAILCCNPWSPFDAVFLDDDDSREEYVLAEQGSLYRGSAHDPSAMAWRYDQFDHFVVEAVLDRLLSTQRASSLSDPILLSRLLSKLLNSNDDDGLLVGNWSGKYDGGTFPGAWSGSSAIFEQYVRSKGRPVRYGQCWVFAGVLTSACRMLGIPCRPVTNFESAHDSPGYDRIISMFVDVGEDGSWDVVEGKSESVWNFHVWNEVWMTRADLGASARYDGWQAIDATPQESSGRYMQMGPAPLAAVREGDSRVGYDTAFVLSEVNADKVYYVREYGRAPGEYELASVDTESVGAFLLTSAPPSLNEHFRAADGRVLPNTLDVTTLYKSPEGSLAERASLLGGVRRAIARNRDEHVTFTPSILGGIKVGSTLGLEVKWEGLKAGETVRLQLGVYSSSYTGRAPKRLVSALGEATEGAASRRIEVSPDEYRHALSDTGFFFEMRCHATVLSVAARAGAEAGAAAGEAIQHWSHTSRVDLHPPELTVSGTRIGAEGGSLAVHVGFTNPCDFALGAAHLHLSAPRGLQWRVAKGNGAPVGPTAAVGFTIVISHSGGAAGRSAWPADLAATITMELDTDVLTDVRGQFDVTFASAEEEEDHDKLGPLPPLPPEPTRLSVPTEAVPTERDDEGHGIPRDPFRSRMDTQPDAAVGLSPFAARQPANPFASRHRTSATSAVIFRGGASSGRRGGRASGPVGGAARVTGVEASTGGLEWSLTF